MKRENGEGRRKGERNGEREEEDGRGGEGEIKVGQM